MPRKKLNPDDSTTATPPPTPEATPKRPRGRPRKAVAEAAPAPAVTPVEAAPSAPKRRGRPPKAAAATETPAAAPSKTKASGGRGRKPAAKPEPVAETPKRRGRPPKAAASTAPAPTTPAPTSNSSEAPKRRGRPPKADRTLAAAVEPVATVAEPTPASVVSEPEVLTTAFDLGDERELRVEFRSRTNGAPRKPDATESVAEEPAVAEPAVEEPKVEDSEPASETPATVSPLEGDDENEPLPTFTFRARTGAAPQRRPETRPEPKPSTPRNAPVAPTPLPELKFVPFEDGLSEDEMPLISWRPKGSGTPTSEAEDADEPTAIDDDRSGRRRRGRGRRDDREGAPEGAAEAPEAVEPPKPAVKPPIAIPPHAPQVVLRNGVPVLVRNGHAYPALAFSGAPNGTRQESLTFEQVRMAAVDGVHLHVMHLPVEVDANEATNVAERAAHLLDRVAEADPEAQTILFVEFVAPRDADRRFPDAVYRRTDGRPAEPSVCDDAYWGEAAAVLRTVIERLGENPRLMGLQLDRGWLHPEEEGYDTSAAAAAKFRAWTRTRYGNDVVALRAAWFDGRAEFDSLTPPAASEAAKTSDRFIRTGRRQRRAVDYHLFLSDVTAARIGELARAVKEASQGLLLVGVDYGQTLEGVHPAGGHLALGKVMRTPEIDFVAGPPSYSAREPGGSAAFPAPVDSFPLNGKLYLSVEDYRTSLGGTHGSDEEGNPVLRTPQMLESVHWRGVGAALAHGMGLAWTDATGDGALRSNSVWERAKGVLEALTMRIGTPMGDPEVAVFIDERALAYLVDVDAFELLVRDVRESILRAGVSAAFYLLSDLAHRERFPDSKLYVFLNAWDIRPESRAAIKTRLQRDGKVLFWVYAAGLFDAGRESLERAREVTGIALKPQPFASRSGTTLLNRRHALAEAFRERTVSGNSALEPTYFAIPEDATVLGEYTQTGLPSFVVRDFGVGGPMEGRWTSVFLGEPKVTPSLVRALAQMAGAHVWDFSDDLVHVRPPFLTVHCRNTGARTVALPDKLAAYDLVGRNWASVDGTNLRFIGVDGATHSFLVGARAEIEHLLELDPESVLAVEELPPRELNVRQNASDFDVPIMRLGEFIVSGEGDEVADEWFLRPAPEAEETTPAPAQAEEAPGQVGRRRRRRRRGGSRDHDEVESGASDESAAPAASNEDFGISVVFRKRQ